MTNKKTQTAAGITIVILLVLFAFLSGYGLYLHSTNVEVVKENTNKETYFDGALWFYNTKGELLGTYTCENDNCDIGKNTVTDASYAINYYESGNEDLPIINDRYVFIKDNADTSESVFLYDISTGVAYKTNKYKTVKNYGVGIAGNLYIVQSENNTYGVLDLSSSARTVITASYNFIGLTNYTNTKGEILSDYFVVLSSGTWNIIDQNEAILTSNITNEIVDYNGEYIIIKDLNEYYELVDYNGNSVLSESYINLTFVGSYLGCINDLNEFYVIDISSSEIISSTYFLEDSDTAYAIVNDSGNIEIYINDVLEETI